MAGKAVTGRAKKTAKTVARKAPGVTSARKETRPGDPVVGSQGEESGGADKGPDMPVKPLRPSQCRGFMRKRIAEEFPKIVHGFLEEAKTGNCAHVKLASDLLEKPAVKGASRKKGSAERMLEELRAL